MNPFTLSFILRVVDSASSASGETHTQKTTGSPVSYRSKIPQQKKNAAALAKF